MWRSDRDLSTARICETEWEREYKKRTSLEHRADMALERLGYISGSSGLATIKAMYENAGNLSEDNVEYMSARDFLEKGFLSWEDSNKATPNSIGQLLKLFAEIYDLDVIEVYDYWPNGKSKAWIRLYPIPCRRVEFGDYSARQIKDVLGKIKEFEGKP